MEGKRNNPSGILRKREIIRIHFLFLAQEIQTGEQTIQFSSGKVAGGKVYLLTLQNIYWSIYL
jgi:hypothetical protein